MATPYDWLKQRAGEDWLVFGPTALGGTPPSQTLLAAVRSRLAELETIAQSLGRSPILLLIAPEPLPSLAAFLAAVSLGYPVFWGNPQWRDRDRDPLLQTLQPDIVVEGKGPVSQRQPTASPPPFPLGAIGIATGGSTGQIRFALHTWETLTASVQGLQRSPLVAGGAIHCFCVLPLFHVSGLMQLVRSLTTGGHLTIGTFKALEQDLATRGKLAHWLSPKHPSFLSLVPTQLQRLLAIGPQAATWLQQFPTIFLGGAPAWPALLDRARTLGLRLAPTYGMTETASMVTVLAPDDFLAGRSGCGQPLPHATLHRNDNSELQIQARSLFLGYWEVGKQVRRVNAERRTSDREPSFHAHSPLPTPHPSVAHTFSPDDLGEVDTQGYWRIVGRRSDKIITGGENVFPAEVESVIRATGLVQDVVVLGIPDGVWGEVVTAVYVPESGVGEEQLVEAIGVVLTPYKRPRRWVGVQDLGRSGLGKVSRERLREALVAKGFGEAMASQTTSLGVD